jgi:hypothetical protein
MTTSPALSSSLASPSALTAEETSRLRRLESIIAGGLEGFLQVGAALAEIRSRRLYRGTHARWEDYCLDKWRLSFSRCNQIIQTTAIYGNLLAAVPQDAELLKQTNEHLLRPLSRLEPAAPICRPGSTTRGDTTRTRRMLDRRSEELANFCKWVNRLAIWDVEAIALSDDALCAQRRLKATRQLRTFCETLIQALETRLLRANGQARAAANI